MNKLIKTLNIHFFISIGILAVLFILVLINQISFVADEAVGVIAERYSIGLTLIAIPVALKLFADMLGKHTHSDDVNAAAAVYKKAFFLRLYIIHFMVLVNLVLYAMSHNMNFVWLTVVLFIVYIFCRPSLEELESLTIKEEEGEQADE